MIMNLIDKIEKKQIETILAQREVPEFGPGDTLKIDVKVVEGTRERVQAFEGVCIGRKNDGIGSSFTVRKMSYGEGVERVFPLYSPKIASIIIVRKGRVRRAKLYYLRDRRGKSARIVEKIEVKNKKEIKTSVEKNTKTVPNDKNLSQKEEIGIKEKKKTHAIYLKRTLPTATSFPNFPKGPRSPQHREVFLFSRKSWFLQQTYFSSSSRFDEK